MILLFKKCLICEDVFYKPYSRSVKDWNFRSKYCSITCRRKGCAENMKVNNPGGFKRETFVDKTKHPRWKGGISGQSWYHSIYRRNYKLRKKGAEGAFYPKEWVDLKTKYNFMCLCCKKQEPEIKLEADHVLPLCKGGSNYIENIQPLCRSCNAQKYKSIIDYRCILNRELI